jgi:hypothetical protein
MKKEMSGAIRRITWKAKLIVILILLVGAAFSLVAAFAAGFVTGTVLGETSREDACRGMEATWDADNKLCIKAQAVQPTLQPLTDVTGDAYGCGDGTTFTLQVGSSSVLFARDGQAPRTLATVSEGSLTRYEDDGVIVTPDGLDATFEDKAAGTKTACTMEAPELSQE